MKLYISDIKNLLDLQGVELLEENRRIRLFRYRYLEDQARCLTAGLMLRCVFGEEAAANITLSETGKPILPGGPCFNLSHSGDKVVLLEDERDVGVDIERIVPWKLSVAKRAFTSREQEWLMHQSTDEAFYRLWTGKEAVMKAVGLGFKLSPERFEILPESAVPNFVCEKNWYLRWQEVQGYMLCTASEYPEELPIPIPLSRSDLLKNKMAEGKY